MDEAFVRSILRFRLVCCICISLFFFVLCQKSVCGLLTFVLQHFVHCLPGHCHVGFIHDAVEPIGGLDAAVPQVEFHHICRKVVGQFWAQLFLNVWMEKVPFESYTPNYKNPLALISLLKGNLAALQTLYKLLPENGLSLKETKGWSIGEVFLHFLDVDKQINIPRFEKIVREDDSFIEGKIPNTWISKERYQNEDVQNIFDSFSNQRLLLISFLESLNENDWRSKCRHSIFGPSNLIELVDFAARHDRIHIRQLHKILKSNDISLG